MHFEKWAVAAALNRCYHCQFIKNVITIIFINFHRKFWNQQLFKGKWGTNKLQRIFVFLGWRLNKQCVSSAVPANGFSKENIDIYFNGRDVFTKGKPTTKLIQNVDCLTIWFKSMKMLSSIYWISFRCQENKRCDSAIKSEYLLCYYAKQRDYKSTESKCKWQFVPFFTHANIGQNIMLNVFLFAWKPETLVDIESIDGKANFIVLTLEWAIEKSKSQFSLHGFSE